MQRRGCPSGRLNGHNGNGLEKSQAVLKSAWQTSACYLKYVEGTRVMRQKEWKRHGICTVAGYDEDHKVLFCSESAHLVYKMPRVLLGNNAPFVRTAFHLF